MRQNMAKGRGNKVNRGELAATFGVTVVTIDAWLRAGCPFDERGAGKGKPWVFDTADVAAWREARAHENASPGDDGADEKELKRRKLRAETGLAELELQKAAGEVAPIRDFERAHAAMFSAIRQNVMNVPQRVVVQLLGETDETAFKQKLAAELRLALETAAEAEIELDDEEAGEDAEE